MSASPGVGAPEWLALLPFLLFAAWRWRGALGSPLRLLCLVLLVLVLAEPRWPRGGGQDVWLLLDRSASARDLLEPRRAEIESLLARSRGGSDRLFVVDYAETPRLRAGDAPAGPGAQTRTAAAVLFALARLEPARAARLLVVTDGYGTEPLTGLAERLAAQGVALDYRLLPLPSATDYQAEAVLLPPRVQAEEPFVIEVRVAGAPDGDVPLTIRRDAAEVGRAVAAVRNGTARLRFTDRLGATGAFRYSAEVQAPGDALRGNDRAAGWVEVTAGPRVLLVTRRPDSPLLAALATQRFPVEGLAPGELSLGRLAGARLLVLEDVSADLLPRGATAALDAFVRVQGGGLLMTGGRSSFGSGGWFQSPLDPLLPVSMETRREHRRVAVAMAIVMDRSGSMAATVAGGLTKMDLANAGAARSIELLGDLDAVAIIAVDSEPHRVVPLSSLGEERPKLVEIVRRIQSTGGGIFVYKGLEAGWEELRRAPHAQRHLVLFADAADAEEPGAYVELLARMREAGVTVSVIALGTPEDQDAPLLVDVAARGGGRIFFSADAATLPEMFAQDTVAVARSAFVDEPAALRWTAGWLELAARPLMGPAQVDGHNLCSLREGATAAAITTDDEPAPLVASWQRGAGRVAAVTFPVSGSGSARVRSWPAYGDFVQTLARWLAGPEAPPGLAARTRLEGTQLGVELLYDATWASRLAASPPRLLIVEGSTGEAREVAWERLAPGRLSASVPLEAGRVYRGAVAAAGSLLPFGPIEGPSGAEWARDRARVRELRTLSEATGGIERLDLASIWKARGSGPRDLRPLLLVALLVLYLLETLRARLDVTAAELRAWLPSVRPRLRPRPEPAPLTSEIQTASAQAAAPSATRAGMELPPSRAPAADEAGRRARDRFRRARGAPR